MANCWGSSVSVLVVRPRHVSSVSPIRTTNSGTRRSVYFVGDVFISRHRKAPSYLIRRSCKLAYQEFGWQIFTAYGDPQAGELGQLYKLAGFQYIGQNIGRNSERGHESWLSPTGETASTHSYRQTAISLGWTEEMGKMGITKAQFLRNIGWQEKDIAPKHKFVRFEGPREERERLKEMCQYEFLPFPKRMNS